jgi:fatty-acyl-CoA synthase
MQLVHQYLLDSARRYTDKAAIIYEQHTFTYAELIRKINTLAEVFIVEGLRKGDRVLILLDNKVEFIVACYAAIRAGGIAVPINEQDSLETIAYIAKQCTPSIFMTSSQDLKRSPALRDILSCSFFFVEEIERPSIHAPYDSPTMLYLHSGDGVDRISQFMNLQTNDGAMILYTSSVNDRSEGVVITHQNLIQATKNCHLFTAVDSGLSELVTLPLSQSVGFERINCLLSCGSTIVLSQRSSDPATIIHTFLDKHCTALSITSSSCSELLLHHETIIKRIGTQLRAIEIGGHFLPALLKRKLLDMFPSAKVFMSYGITEAPYSTFIELRSERKKAETLGRKVLHVELSICDDQENLLPQGQTGELLIRGNHVALGYWRNEELTRSRFVKQNWLRTGDIGYLDKDGYLHLLGKKDELISTGDATFFPVEVEEKIHAVYPEYEICVVGIPGPVDTVGEIPVLCYIAKEGKTIIPSELSATLSTQLDKNKIPRIVYRVDDLPRIDNKIHRKELRKKLMEGVFQPVYQSTSS